MGDQAHRPGCRAERSGCGGVTDGRASPAGGTTAVALLRGINLRPHKRVPMADLRAAALDVGLRDPCTLLNSGNLAFVADAFDDERIARDLRAAVLARTGVDATVFVRTLAELEAVLAGDPFGEEATDSARLLVVIPGDPADLAGLAPLQARDWSPERLGVTAEAAWLWCPDGISRGALAVAALKLALSAGGGERTVTGGTSRNRATLRKLRDLAASLPAC